MFNHETFIIFTKSQEQEQEQEQQLCYFMDRLLRSRGQKQLLGNTIYRKTSDRATIKAPFGI